MKYGIKKKITGGLVLLLSIMQLYTNTAHAEECQNNESIIEQIIENEKESSNIVEIKIKTDISSEQNSDDINTETEDFTYEPELEEIIINNGYHEPEDDTSVIEIEPEYNQETNDFIKGSVTAYCISGITASGIYTTYGIAAGKAEWLGRTVRVYKRLPGDIQGKLLGTYKIMDTGGTEGLKNGKVIDIWCSSMEEVNEIAEKSYSEGANGKIFIELLDESDPTCDLSYEELGIMNQNIKETEING